MPDNSDLSSLSDEQLQQLHLQSMSDDELAALHQQMVPSFTDRLMQTWPVKAAQSLYSAATLPGDVIAGKGDVAPTTPGQVSDEDMARLQANNQNIGERTLNLAAAASPTPTAMRAGEGAMGAAVTPKLVPRAPIGPATQQLYDAADGDYAVARAMDVNINPTAVKNFASGLQLQMERGGLRDYLAPKTFAALKEMQSAPDGSVANISDIDGMRKVFGGAARDFTNPTEQMAATRAIKALDNFVPNLDPGDVISGDAGAAQNVLNSARGNFAAAHRAELIDSKQDRAALNAGSAGSGGNIDNAQRQQIKSILTNKKLSSQYNDDELDQMRSIVTGTPVGNAARLVGKLAPTGAVSGAIGAGLGAALAGGPGAAALPVVGTIAKKIGDASTQRGIDALNNAIRMRSPLAQTMAAIPVRAPTPSVTPLRVIPAAQSGLGRLISL